MLDIFLSTKITTEILADIARNYTVWMVILWGVFPCWLRHLPFRSFF